MQFTFTSDGNFTSLFNSPNFSFLFSQSEFSIAKIVNIGDCLGCIRYFHNQKAFQTYFLYRQFHVMSNIPLNSNGPTNFSFLRTGPTYNFLTTANLQTNLQNSNFMATLLLNPQKANIKLSQTLSIGPSYHENILYQISSKYYGSHFNLYNCLLLSKTNYGESGFNFIVGIKSISKRKIIDRFVFTKLFSGETFVTFGNCVRPGNDWKLKWEVKGVLIPENQIGFSVCVQKD